MAENTSVTGIQMHRVRHKISELSGWSDWSRWSEGLGKTDDPTFEIEIENRMFYPEPPPAEQLFGPYGYLNGPRFLNEESWEVEWDSIGNNDEYFSIPLFAKVEPIFPVTYGTPEPTREDGVTHDAFPEVES